MEHIRPRILTGAAGLVLGGALMVFSAKAQEMPAEYQSVLQQLGEQGDFKADVCAMTKALLTQVNHNLRVIYAAALHLAWESLVEMDVPTRGHTQGRCGPDDPESHDLASAQLTSQPWWSATIMM